MKTTRPRIGPLWLAVLSACAAPPATSSTRSTSTEPLATWMARQEERSWGHLLANISPAEPKQPGGPRPARGIVVGALSKKDPDYYFHWIRDSSTVMRVVVEVAAAERPYARSLDLAGVMGDFLSLTRTLQQAPSAHGLGEPRFNVDGTPDTLPWSRPQFDGPALRALAVLRYLRGLGGPPDPATLEVLGADLDFAATVWPRRGFDVWEEYNAENYHTRLVQLAALEQGADYLAGQRLQPDRVARYRDAAVRLEPLLDDHWDPARGFLRSQLVIVATDGYTAKKTDLDSAVIIAVIEADRQGPAHSVLDDRVQATVAVLEDLFRRTYPINARTDAGLAYGRYQGDIYYGGNPWFLITAYYAEFYYRLATRLKDGSLAVTKRNLGFVRGLVGDAVAVDTAIRPGEPLHGALVRRSIERGDAIMRRFQLHTPADGQIYEQFDKQTGAPASSRGIGWGHAALLSATLARARAIR